MIEFLSEARNIKEFEDRIPDAVSILAEYRQRLREGQVSLSDLVISRNLSQDPKRYEKATLSAVVSQELLARGIKLDTGESIQYIITNAQDKDPASRARAYVTLAADHSYDTEKYTELLLKAGESLFSLFGYDMKRLKRLTDFTR
jgi:DNA polymerase-2